MTLPMQHPVVRPNTTGRRRPEDPQVSWRERLQALRHLPRLLRMVWDTEPRYVVGILLLRIARALVPLAVLWIGKLIVDEVVQAVAVVGAGGAIPWVRLAELLALELGIALVGEGLARLSALLESLLGDLFANRTSVELMRHSATLDLEQFENAEIYDKLERARRQTVGRIGLFTLLLATVQDLITLVTLGVALAVYVPWLLLLLAVAVLPSLLGETHFASLGYSLLYSWTPERRQLDYLRYIAASDISAKELKLFGLSDFLVGRYDRLSREFYEANKALAIRRSLVSSLLAAVGTLGYYGAYAVDHLPHGDGLPVSGRPVHHRGAHLSRGLLPPEPRPDSTGAAVALADLRAEPLSRRPVHLPRHRAAHPTHWRRAARAVPDSRGVQVRERRVQVSRRGALGGARTRVHADAGRADRAGGRERGGKDHAGQAPGPALRPDRRSDPARRGGPPGVRPLQPAAKRGRDLPGLRALRLPAPGEHRRGEHQPAGGPAGHRERRRAEAWRTRWRCGSPGGYGQMLGRRFEGGVDLSGGEWQKVALARAYMRDAQLLILDEPTAALDARAEYEVFLRFSELTKGRMAVLISHRFSTVRMADRILVLRGGELVEQGTHEELLAVGGLYSELFQLQAGYR